jgi:superfamily II DNA or RNA helicase
MENLSRNGLWFNPKSIQEKVAQGPWQRGLSLYLAQRVLSLEIDPHQGHWRLRGEVQGTERLPYEVSVELKLTPGGQLHSWDSDCTCPVRYQCKHGVALMVKAAYKGLQLLGAEAGAVNPVMPPTPAELDAARKAHQARMDEIARLEAEAQVLRWLESLDRASGHADEPGEAPGAHGGRIRPEQYLYLLSVAGGHGPAPRLQLEAVVSYPKLNGGWAKPKPLRHPPIAGQAVYDQASAADHEVLQLMRALKAGDDQLYRYGTTFIVTPAGRIGPMTLEQAAATGRLFLDQGGGPGPAVTWGPPQPLRWAWHEVTTAQAAEPGWVLRAQLADSGARLCLNSPPLYLDVAKGLCGLAQADGVPAAQLEALLKAPPLKPSALKKHQASLTQRLGPVPLPPMLEALPTLQGITPKACLHLYPTPAGEVAGRGLLQAQLRFDYAGRRGWWAGQGLTVLVDDAQGRVLLRRDGEAELEALSALAGLGLHATGVGAGLFGIPGKGSQTAWLHWADNGFAVFKEAGFEVTQDDALAGWITRADILDVQLRPQGHSEGNAGEDSDEGATSPWFDLSLGIEINGERHNILPWLPELIAAAAASPPDPATGLPTLPPFVYLRAPGLAHAPIDAAQPGDAAGNSFIRLPTDTLKPWMAALLELVGDRSHDFSADSLKLSRLDALRTTAALGEGALWEGAQTLRALVRQLGGHAEMPEVAVPASVQASLRPYQQQGVNWLQFLREHALAGILADDMGLGKTLQTLVHIQVEKDAGRLTHPALIIAPVSLMGNWRREAERFCPDLRALVIHGKDRHEVAGTMAEFDVVIAPYSLLQRDRERWLEAQWHLVVLDEAQNIKNASTHAAQVVGQLHTRHRLCLSGTPMENHLGEIWSLFHFLMPGFLGSQKRFTELFRTPIEKQSDPERLAQLRARITPFMLRRTKALVAHELPPKIETVMRVELSGKQADLYETIRLGMEKTVREALNTKGLAKSQITILDALLKLRQVCCDPSLLKLDAAKKVKTSAKLEQLMELLPEMLAEGRRILLFSQFTSMLTLIEAELKKRDLKWVKLTGQSQNRDALITQFTSGAVPLFLISLKAGGTGLNLPQADTVIHYDPWWNPAVETQATDRAHRIGQTQSVWVVKLVAQGTIEERILALQERKAALADSMYSGATGRKQPLFTEGDLAVLLKPLSG